MNEHVIIEERTDVSQNAVAVVDDLPSGVEIQRSGIHSGGLILPSPEQMQTLQQFGEMYVKSGLLPEGIKTWQAVAVTIQHGMDLGLPISTAIQQIYVIKGKPVCSAALMASLIYRDHGDDALQLVESTDKLATYKFKRRSWSEYQSYTYTFEDAKQASLTGRDTWKNHPKSMLRARCLADIAHAQFQDSIGGLYLQDELEHLVKPAVGGQVTPINQTAAENLAREQQSPELTEVVDWENRVAEAIGSDQTYESMKAKIIDLVNLARRRRDCLGFTTLITRVPMHDTAEHIYAGCVEMDLAEDSGIASAIVYRRRIAQEAADAAQGKTALDSTEPTGAK